MVLDIHLACGAADWLRPASCNRRRTTSDERAAGSGSKGLRQADAWKAAGSVKKAAAFAGRGA